MCVCRPSNYNNSPTFFDKITLSLNKAALKFENLPWMTLTMVLMLLALEKITR